LPNAFGRTAFANSPLAESGTTENHSADTSRSSRHLRHVTTLPGKKKPALSVPDQTQVKARRVLRAWS
jgi:hypothetical protein